ncbi:RING/U-box superfamily protein [Euphorbia peplus]|nr:RING/U-box superfamily protein [Euphorbia peplus]
MSSSDPPPLPPPQPNLNSPSVTIVLTVILLVFFFIGFFSIYFCRCFMESVINSWHFRRTPSGNVINLDGTSAGDGLDPSLIILFPTFNYSSVKNYQREKYGLECAICLSEFEDEDALRLLTVCYHIFHQECIDLWLKSHKTCPVCRTDLDLPRETLEKAQILPDHHNNVNNDDHSIDASQNKSICIDIRDDDYDDKDNDKKSNKGGNGEVVTSHNHTNTEKVVNHEKNMEKSHSRSHSTGHSIATTREGDQDKYTLRLQENVKVRIKTGHNATESCITFGELTNILREEPSGFSNGNIVNNHVS